MFLNNKFLKNSLIYTFCATIFLIQKNKNFNLYAINDTSNSSIEQQLMENLSSEKNSDESDKKTSENSEGETSTSYDIYNFLCENSKIIFMSADQKKLKELEKDLKSIYEHLNKNYFISSDSYDIADMAVISLLLNHEIIDSEKNQVSQTLSEAIEIYKSDEKNKYDFEKYNNMKKSSETFGNSHKKSANCNPENIVSLKEGKSLNEYPISYDENILISLNDATNISGINPEIEYMDNNSTILLKFNGNILEIEQGSNRAYLNDSQVVMENSVLNINGTTYVPASILNLMGCKTISHDNAVIVY